ncbi:putative methyltransferase [Wickerhamomyces ciferrii]|uniref:peptide chain release factor N(5)-glutamine methyltransferase n=1 Tax=Wickerhamomyces ciferrii (strain ATCC 14091 / BCRC 22168 / CBS 111 / JCM 3599 / NBRC 0793 / NRRL Y-1031 F-60-10) TaxID=1206466 RepID=K0KHX1_WICCF|nr:putative methyltransferase [Wickerhamomyces ciferrii]CCH40753.1 putative methyltransferase [Wickerhamomyces ciferrii]
MVRCSLRLFQKASKTTQNQKWISSLLPVCKTPDQAKQELRWIQMELPQDKWDQAIQERSKFIPLQYILGSQPFGSLDIKCRPQVLIPRWETEEWTLKIINKLRGISSLKILDVCTGTGCIPLLMGHSLPHLQIKAMDISSDALELSNENKKIHGITNVEFKYGNVFDKGLLEGEEFDLITSNPPYISELDYLNGETEESVLQNEPKLALVGGLEFYDALVNNVVLPSKATGFFFELGDLEQALYTQSLLNKDWCTKIYKDGADKIRCVYGWKKGSKMQVLEFI